MNHAIASHIALEGAFNARDLGGYPAAGGAKTARYAFFRCESPAHLTASDVDLLIGLGLRAVIDLRNENEILREPGPFGGRDDIAYHHIPLLAAPLPPHMAGGIEMGALYVHMLDSAQPGFLAICRAILAAPGGVLFHCTAGKDRTGLTAALLLLCAGVARQTVLDEYALTERLLAPWVAAQTELARRRGRELDRRLLAADPAYLAQALDHLDAAYGGAAGYLRAAGLSQPELDALAGRVLKGWAG